MADDRTRVETREVCCTHCDRYIEIPASAMSVNCRHCHRRVVIEDLKIKGYHSVVRLATAGKVEVLKNARVIAQVRVEELVVNGNVKGDVTALGAVRISKKGVVEGNVACRALAVEPGASLNGHYHVDPAYTPEPAEAADDF